MLDLYRLSEEFADFNAYQADEHRRMEERLARACEALRACSRSWKALKARAEQNRSRAKRLIAGLRENPAAAYAGAERPTPVTVVATDGSQIYPDRHVEPPCYLLNISRVAFQYGTLERPLLEATPHFHYRQDDWEKHFDALRGSMSAEVVSAIRDEYELQVLLEAAREARTEGRPLVALADGTLIRWMIRGMRNRALEQDLIRRYTEILTAFQQERIPLCSYISMPGNTEVVNLLQLHLEEEGHGAPGEEEALSGLRDRRLFAETLRPGERSATFLSASLIQEEYPPEDQICYFYLSIPSGEERASEVGRVEVPRWVAEEEDLLDLVHSVVLDECRKGKGYPVILSEAHERAVIRARERELFYRLIERELGTARLPYSGSRKRAAKRQPLV